MNAYLIRRLLFAIPTLLAISFIIYAIISLAPGDPLSQFAANPAVPPEVRENIRRSLGLDRPWYERYGKWLWTLVTEGNMGYSFASRIPVTELIFKFKLLPTLWVVGTNHATVCSPSGSDCVGTKTSPNQNMGSATIVKK